MDSIIEEVDLFEQHETLPKIIQDIISGYDYDTAEKHKEAERLLILLTPHGYTFEYGLCGEPHSLRRTSPCDLGDWAMISSEAVEDEGFESNYGMVMGFSRDITKGNTDYNYWVHLTLKNGKGVMVGTHEIKKLY